MLRFRIVRQPGIGAGRYICNERVPNRHETAEGATEAGQRRVQALLGIAEIKQNKTKMPKLGTSRSCAPPTLHHLHAPNQIIPKNLRTLVDSTRRRCGQSMCRRDTKKKIIKSENAKKKLIESNARVHAIGNFLIKLKRKKTRIYKQKK